MNLLLDSCALLALGNGTLPPRAARALETAVTAGVSVVSPWELAIKAARGKLSFREPVYDWFCRIVATYHLGLLRLDPRTACAAAALPPIHSDPFDRVLVATALEHELTIVTCDKIVPTYPGILTLW